MTARAPNAPRRAGLRALALLLGFAIVVADVAHWWTEARRHDVVDPGHVPLLLLGVVIAAAGALGRRFVPAYRAAGIMLLNTILTLACVELLASMYLWTHTSSTSGPRGAVYRVAPGLPYYRTRPWGTRYWEEFADANPLHYAPYVVFRRYPFAGRYVNVDARRLRVTPGARCGEAGSLVVWMFGGSTLWGTGAPDSLTIPALVQRGLARREPRPVCVVNFGESAFVSTQELVQLTLALRGGGRPHAVIFYDGVNDVYSAFQAGHAGAHQNEDRIAARFEQGWGRQALDSLRTMIAVRQIVRPPAGRRPAASTLADSVSAAYLGTVDLVRALGRQYGFRTLFFWQPELSESRKPMTRREADIERRMGTPLKALYRETYARVAAAARPDRDLHDISGALASDPADLFLDFAHIVPDGNAHIADAILRTWDQSAGRPLADATR